MTIHWYSESLCHLTKTRCCCVSIYFNNCCIVLVFSQPSKKFCIKITQNNEMGWMISIYVGKLLRNFFISSLMWLSETCKKKYIFFTTLISIAKYLFMLVKSFLLISGNYSLEYTQTPHLLILIGWSVLSDE